MAAASAMEGAAARALRSVVSRVQHAADRCGRRSDQIRVMAVGKTKPVSLIRQLYDAGHRCFAENYVQEFIEKAPQLPDDIEWHFIGHLQSNKVKSLLAAVPYIAMVESVDNEKVANYLDRFVANIGRKPLKVLVQVNTSGEASKYGVEPSSCVELAKHVKMGCPNLEFAGLMTIGMLDYTSTPENFQTLSNCRTEVCKALGMTEEHCELSMGMSGDFEKAIEMGSTNVRIGSTIFGPREYPNKQDQTASDPVHADASTITIGCWKGRTNVSVMVALTYCIELHDRLRNKDSTREELNDPSILRMKWKRL